jgi:hypothetical protein
LVILRTKNNEERYKVSNEVIFIKIYVNRKVLVYTILALIVENPFIRRKRKDTTIAGLALKKTTRFKFNNNLETKK